MVWGFLAVGLWFLLMAAIVEGAGPMNYSDPLPDYPEDDM